MEEFYQGDDYKFPDVTELNVSRGVATVTTGEPEEEMGAGTIIRVDSPAAAARAVDYWSLTGMAAPEIPGQPPFENILDQFASYTTLFTLACLTPDQYNNPNFILTRSHISEFKGFIKPFSNFITINQTDDEKTNSIVRLHADKFRKKPSSITFWGVQSLNSHRFFNLKKTREMFGS